MLERLKQLPAKLLELWNKYTKKQRTIFLSIVGSVILLLVLLIIILGRTSYMEIASFEDINMAASAVDTLTTNGIKARLSDNRLSVEADVESEVQARILIAGTYGDDELFSIASLIDNGLETTNSDRRLKNDLYVRSEIESSLKSLNGIEDATVIFYPTSANTSILSKADDINCSVFLTLSTDISTKKARYLAEIVSYALGNSSVDTVKIMDQDANLIFGGSVDENEEELDARIRYAAQATDFFTARIVEAGTKNHFETEASLYLDIDFSERSVVFKEYIAAEGQDQGLLATLEKISSENTGTSGDLVGTDANDEQDYFVQESGSGNSSYDSLTETYLPSERLTNILETNIYNTATSTLAVTLNQVTPVYESDLELLGIIGEEMSFDEYIANNREPRLMDEEEYQYMYGIMSMASGIPEANIRIAAYESFDFIAKEVTEFDWSLILKIVLAVLIIGLLIFVVFRGMQPEKVVEMEPELSVEQLLATTKENQSLDDIELSEKSETRRLIEKLVDDNPEAVANLLRNWLNDEWG